MLQFVQRTSRLDAELRLQRAPSGAVGVERFGLTARAIQGEHQLRAQTLA
jgi:hypothetical protein